jgi:hypothetical protein
MNKVVGEGGRRSEGRGEWLRKVDLGCIWEIQMNIIELEIHIS